MVEHINSSPSPENNSDELELTRQQVLIGFALPILDQSPWINSKGADEDIDYDLRAIKTRKTWQPGQPITAEHRYNVASRLVLRDLLKSFKSEKPLTYDRQVWEVDDLYDETDQALDIKPLALTNFDTLLKGVVLCCFRGKIPETPTEQAAYDVLQERGTIWQEMIGVDDLLEEARDKSNFTDDKIVDVAITPSEMLVEYYPIPMPAKHKTEIPFYKQYLSATKNSTSFLRAYLEDLQKLDSKIRGLGQT